MNAPASNIESLVLNSITENLKHFESDIISNNDLKNILLHYASKQPDIMSQNSEEIVSILQATNDAIGSRYKYLTKGGKSDLQAAEIILDFSSRSNRKKKLQTLSNLEKLLDLNINGLCHLALTENSQLLDFNYLERHNYKNLNIIEIISSGIHLLNKSKKYKSPQKFSTLAESLYDSYRSTAKNTNNLLIAAHFSNLSGKIASRIGKNYSNIRESNKWYRRAADNNSKAARGYLQSNKLELAAECFDYSGKNFYLASKYETSDKKRLSLLKNSIDLREKAAAIYEEKGMIQEYENTIKYIGMTRNDYFTLKKKMKLLEKTAKKKEIIIKTPMRAQDINPEIEENLKLTEKHYQDYRSSNEVNVRSLALSAAYAQKTITLSANPDCSQYQQASKLLSKIEDIVQTLPEPYWTNYHDKQISNVIMHNL